MIHNTMMTIKKKTIKEICKKLLDHFRKTHIPCVTQKPHINENDMKCGNGCLPKSILM